MIRWLIHILQGVGIGAANVIPGVSGGTMALIFGIYERLIDAVEAVVHAGLALLRLDFRQFIALVSGLPWLFILPLGLGILVAPLMGARVIPGLLERWPEHSRSLFFGLILGSVAIPWLRARKITAFSWFLACLAAILAWWIAEIPSSVVGDPGMIRVFLTAVLAISAMILPGVSGAYILLILGMYSPVLRAVDERNLVFVAVFIAGAGVGLGGFSVFLGWLLRRYHDLTMAVLVGLMAGSLRALWPWQMQNRTLLSPSTGESLPGIIGLFLIGLLVSGAVTVWEIRHRRTRTESSGAIEDP